MLGIDLIEINRFKGISRNDFSSWNKVFAEAEWEYCFKQPLPAQHLAGLFAAKEAVMKAFGEAIMRRYDIIEIEHDSAGQPLVRISLPTERSIEVSISHAQELAVAVALVK